MKKWLVVALLAAAALGLTLLSPIRMPEPAPAGSNASPAAPAPAAPLTTPPPESATEAAPFQQRLDEIAASLPRTSELRALSEEEVHHTPPVLLEAGEKVGEVAEALAANPALKPQAIRFYRDCAKGNETASSVRALCFYHWEKLSQGSADEPGPTEVPPEIRALADKLK